MASSITSADFDLQNFSGDICERLRKLLEINDTMAEFFGWMFNPDGTISSEFLLEIQSIANPVGTVIWRPVESVPDGYLQANGQAVSRTTYANLFAVYGTLHGEGDGSTTFNLPNMTLKFAFGAGTGAGYQVGGTGGSLTHTLTAAEIPAHDHGMPTTALAIRTTVAEGAIGNADNSSSGGGGLVNVATFQSVGGGNAHSNVPPYLAGLWLVKT